MTGHPPPDVVRAIRKIALRRLGPEEFEAFVRSPMTEEERREILSHIAWFVRRYPTPRDRLAHGRRSWRNIVRLAPPAALERPGDGDDPVG